MKYWEREDDSHLVCPYCGYENDVKDDSMIEVEEICGDCGKHFLTYSYISTTYCTVPDCDINGEIHQWSVKKRGDGMIQEVCKVCEKKTKWEKEMQ